jgi:hypothetical protein
MGDQDLSWCGGLRCAYIMFRDKIIKRNYCYNCRYYAFNGFILRCGAFSKSYIEKNSSSNDRMINYGCLLIWNGRDKCTYYKFSFIRWIKSLFNFM